MRKFYSLLIIISFCSTISAQNKLQNLKKELLETSILVPISPIHNIENYQTNTNSLYSFLQAYNMIKTGDFNQRFSALNEKKFRYSLDQQIINIGILNSEFESIKPEAFSDGRITFDNNQNLVNLSGNASIYKKNSISIASPLAQSHKGLNAKFMVSDNYIFNSTNHTISKVEIDFGTGFKNMLFNQPITVSFSEAGNKILNTKITFNDGSISNSKSTLHITASSEDLNRTQNMAITTFEASIAPDLSAYGEPVNVGTGEYDIYLSSDNILDKPIIICDGFDPGDSRDVPSIYSLLDFTYNNGTVSNLGDEMRAEGFDVIVLNFPVYTRASDGAIIDGGVDYIERNAMLMVELINIINAQKVGTEENVIIGPSMGGLITRYALNYMENQSMTHDTRLWISFDSPQQGANVPIGFQSLFNRMAFGLNLGSIAGDQSIVALQPVIDGMLKSPAARQMLTDQFETHLAAGSNIDFDPSLTLPSAHPFHSIFYNNLNSLTTSGYPENVRKVSIINGSGVNARYKDKTNNDILPDREVLNVLIPDVATLTDATFKVRFTPTAGNTNQSSYLYIDAPWFCFCDLTVSTNSQAFGYTDGIDAASGGLFDIGGLSGSLGTDPLINTFFAALQTDYFNFIPTVSSMALEITNNEVDWYHTPNNLITGRTAVNDVTPFDNWYMPPTNEPHVTLTEPNVAFAISEINPTSLNLNSFNDDSIILTQNPVHQSVNLNSSKTILDTEISIIDLTGKNVFKTSKTLDSNTKIPVNFASGIYVLSISKDGATLGQFKIVVN